MMKPITWTMGILHVSFLIVLFMMVPIATMSLSNCYQLAEYTTRYLLTNDVATVGQDAKPQPIGFGMFS